MFEAIRKAFEPPQRGDSPRRNKAAKRDKRNRGAEEMANTLLTEVASEENRGAPEIADTLLTAVASEENRGAPEIADTLLTAVASEENKGTAELGDILTQPIQPGAEPSSEERSPDILLVESSDKSENNAEDDLFTSLFQEGEEEEYGIIGALIASLPNVTEQELRNDAREVRALMVGWQQYQEEEGNNTWKHATPGRNMGRLLNNERRYG